jgi:DNA-binding transcriptional MocR family regulator
VASAPVGYPLGREREAVPIAVLRQAFHESGLSVRELARRLKVHHSTVGRKVRGWTAHQYIENAAGEVVDYGARSISVRHDTAIRYIQAMELDPADYLPRPLRGRDDGE